MPARELRAANTPAPFTINDHVRRKLRHETIARAIFATMIVLMLVPLFAILYHVVSQGAPLISWDFLITNPRKGMTLGGIWSALLGTI